MLFSLQLERISEGDRVHDWGPIEKQHLNCLLVIVSQEMSVLQRGHSSASEHQRWTGSANGLAACMQHQLRLAENGHGSMANGSHSGLCSDLGSDCPSKGVCTLLVCLALPVVLHLHLDRPSGLQPYL